MFNLLTLCRDACYHYNDKTPAEGYHWTLRYSCKGESLTVNKDYPSPLTLVHVKMTWDDYWSEISEMVDNEGLGREAASLKDIIRSCKSKRPDETKK